MFKVGKVLNYFDRTNLAIIELNNVLAVGDKIRVIRSWADSFEEVITSIKSDYENVTQAKSGQTIALQLIERVKKGDEIYKI